jgi:hypothetical protein
MRSDSACKRCGGFNFGFWISASTGKLCRYCRDCRGKRARLYAERRKKNGGGHTRRQWLEKLEQFDRCPDCESLWHDIPPRPNKRYAHVWTKDHIVPLIRGGGDDIDNIQPLCYRCNFSKCGGHRDP